MDGTEAGNRMQRLWQQQIVLETKAIDARCARLLCFGLADEGGRPQR